VLKLATTLVVVALVPARAAAQATEAWQAPTLSITRYDEDWSDLVDAEKRGHHWTGRFKYIPIRGDAWLSTGIELRARAEDYKNNLWGGADAPDDAYLWVRAVPYADVHVDRFRAFVQPVLAYAVGVQPAASPVDQTRADLLQGFGELDLGAVTLRAGRQMLSLGTERLVGTRYGPNVPLAFDGFRGIVRVGSADVSLFAVKPVEPGPDSFDDKSSPTKALWGAYATIPQLDFYYLGYRNRDAHFGGRPGRELRHTLGARYHGARADWRWNLEAAGQFGSFADERIGAWTVATELGRKLSTLPLSPDATLRFNIASGDSNPGDDRLGTFNALFPKGKYFGELSPIGPYNIVNLNPAVSLDLGRNLSLGVAAMAYWRFSRADGVYDIPGHLIRAPGRSRARYIGKEAELTLAWQPTAELELSASISAFQPGAFIRETGPAKAIGMFGLEANFRF